MNGENQKHNRHSIRLKGYDYSEEGAYFVTIVTHDREMLFGKVVDGEMVLNEYGEIVKSTWFDLRDHIDNVELDEFFVMPNHFHGLIIINPLVGVGSKPTPENFNNSEIRTGLPTRNERLEAQKSRGSFRAGHGPAPTGLPEIVRQFKTFSSKRINELRGTTGVAVWQRNYYDHIIRSDKDYDNIANYIAMNPSTWMKDDEYIE